MDIIPVQFFPIILVAAIPLGQPPVEAGYFSKEWSGKKIYVKHITAFICRHKIMVCRSPCDITVSIAEFCHHSVYEYSSFAAGLYLQKVDARYIVVLHIGTQV